jgi:hypothetical protein
MAFDAQEHAVTDIVAEFKNMGTLGRVVAPTKGRIGEVETSDGTSRFGDGDCLGRKAGGECGEGFSSDLEGFAGGCEMKFEALFFKKMNFGEGG